MKDDAQDKKPRRGVKGGTPGPGRPKGSKDSISRDVKQSMSEFFTHLTGVIRDTYDPSRGGTRCVYGCFTKEG